MAFKKGDKVVVLNRTTSCRFVVEGYAVITEMLDHGKAMVRFSGEPLSVVRFVDPAAQADPEAYCDELNAAQARTIANK